MMNTLRYRAKTFLKFVLWAVVISFVLSIFVTWGMKGQFKGGHPDAVAKVYDAYITYQDFGLIWRNRLQAYYDEGIKITEEKEKEIKKQILDEMIDNYLQLHLAKQMKINATDEEVSQAIMSVRAFYDNKGNFDKNRYLTFLYNNRLKPEEFEEDQRKSIILAKLKNFYRSTVKISDDELKSYFLKRHRSIKANYVYFNYLDVLKEIKIDEEKMKDYYAMNKKEFEKPERVKASHILIRADLSPTSPTGLSEEAAENLAKKLLARIKAGEDFAKLAKEFSADPGSKEKGGDLGWFEKGQMVQEFEKIAFALDKGKVSDVFKTQFGYHIVKVTDKDEGFKPTYDKVKNEILKKLQKNEGMKMMLDNATKFKEKLDENKSFEDVAKEMKIKINTTGYFDINTKSTGIESENYKDEVFDLPENIPSEIIEGKNGYYILVIKESKKPEFNQEKFIKEKDELTERLRSIKFNQIYKDLIASLKKHAKVEIYWDNI